MNFRKTIHTHINSIFRTNESRILLLCLMFFNTAVIIDYYNGYFYFISTWGHPKTNTACILPKLNPFEPKIRRYTSDSAETPNCAKRYPLIFYADHESNLILNASLSKYKFSSCCYKIIPYRNDRYDSYSDSVNCYPIENNSTKTSIPKRLEFITVFCKKMYSHKLKVVDMFGFVHLKPHVEDRIKEERNALVTDTNSPDSRNPDPANIVIIGLDSVSHMNFIRTMPKTQSFIMKNLSGISMNGFTKVGDNTLPNMLPVLTGLSMDEARRHCFGKTRLFDDCPFIWNNFSSAGYRTVCIEDAPDLPLFRFETVPTDYYIEPLMTALKNSFARHHSSHVPCYGPRLVFEISLDHLKKAVRTFGNDKRYFYLMWSSVMSHDNLNNPKMGDEFLLNTLQWLSDGNYLNNTIIIVMSDHGMRWGDIRKTYQGLIEERMPFLYTIFPEWVSEKYKTAIENFKLNSERLTTPFDLHETLKDFLDLRNLENVKIHERTADLQASLNIPRGISLFLPISSRRTCKQANISGHYCVCEEIEPISVDDNPEIISASIAIVNKINNITSQFSQCSILDLGSVASALRKEGRSARYIINIVTTPGNANFEATVFKNLDENSWTVLDDISRTNIYGNQSHCMKEEHAKIFCYCKQQ